MSDPAIHIQSNGENFKDLLTLYGQKRPTGRYLAKVHGQLRGPVEARELKSIPGFMLGTLICPEGGNHWDPAYKILDLKTYFEPSHPSGPSRPAPPAEQPAAAPVPATVPTPLRPNPGSGFAWEAEQPASSLATWLIILHLMAYGAVLGWLGCGWVQMNGWRLPAKGEAIQYSRQAIEGSLGVAETWLLNRGINFQRLEGIKNEAIHCVLRLLQRLPQ
jgi:hypothetical protein